MSDDEREFATIFNRHRRELQLHCYRLTGSLQDAEDLVQETFLRAWRRRDQYAGRAPLRAWLYRIATNACLDANERRKRPAVNGEIPWLQPYPDELLEGVPAAAAGPDDVAVARETVELAYIAAIQHVAPQSRAVLILRDVLGWPAKDVAALLDTSVPAVNSALQRAHAVLREHLPERRSAWPAAVDASAAERALLERYVRASEEGDAQGLADLLDEQVRFAMPPQPGVWTGRDEVVASWVQGGFGTASFGRLRCVVTRANGQPAVANYVLRPGDETYRPMALDVVRVEDGRITEVVAFPPDVFPAFGLPSSLAQSSP